MNVEVLDWNTAVVICMPAMFQGAIEFGMFREESTFDVEVLAWIFGRSLV